MHETTSTLIQLPLQWYREMREHRPVFYDERSRSWAIFRYDDAQYVLTHPELFSSVPREPHQPRMPSLLNLDPPRHHKLRAIVAQAFTPRVVEQLSPRISEVTNELLDRVLPNGEMDIVQDLAYPLPITIIAALLGVPAEDRATFRHWSSTLVSGSIEELDAARRDQERIQSARDFDAYFARKLAEKRAQPDDDLMSRLLAAEVDGEHLSEQELIEFCRLLLVAGHETTANLIGNAVLCFTERSEVAAELRAEPALMTSAVEEVLRCYPSVAGATRIATEDTTLGGQQIRRNQALHVLVGSANYDERQFPDPERFDIRRSPNRHLAFGYGIHFCLGAPLARLEARIALTILLERLPNLKRAPGKEIEPFRSFFMHGVKRLPVTF